MIVCWPAFVSPKFTPSVFPTHTGSDHLPLRERKYWRISSLNPGLSRAELVNSLPIGTQIGGRSELVPDQNQVPVRVRPPDLRPVEVMHRETRRHTLYFSSTWPHFAATRAMAAR